MSNNIYDILKKMAGLEAPKQALTESKKAKPDYIDIDKDGDKTEPMKKAAREKSKGAVAEAVAQVEKQLNEKYMGFKKAAADKNMEEGVVPKGTISKTPSGEEEYKAAPGYRVKAEFEPGSTGKPKMGFVKTDPDKEKSQAALPSATTPTGTKEKPVDESGLQAYLGKKKYGEKGMQALQQAGRDGASKEKMARIRAQHDKMDEGSYNEDMLSPKQKSFAALAEPKDKITYADKIAGAKKKTEGNKFSGNLMKARQKGLKRADLDGDGDMEPVREEENKYMNKDGTFKNPRTDAARERQRAEIEQTQKTSDGNWMGPKDKAPKYRPSEYTQGKYSQEIAKAMDQDREERDAARSPLNKIANYGSRLVFGKDMPVNEGRTSMREGWEEMQKYLEKKRGPESKGGAGKKAGTRYGGSAQKDDDEETDGEGKPVEKKKGRPKGTGGGAKFSFKKPKD